MPTTESAIDHPLHSDEHPERHEHTDMSVLGVGLVILGGAIFCAITFVFVYFLFIAFTDIDKHFIDNPALTAIKTPRIQPKEPRIQGLPGYHANLPWQDTADMKIQVNHDLTTYGKTANNDFVRIPIAEAMQSIVSDNSLKVRENPKIPNQGGADNAP